MGRLLPADEALEVGIEYAGVVVFGRVTIVDDQAEATHGLQLLLDKYFPHLKSGTDYKPIDPDALKITAVFRIDIESWSGKEKRVADDFPGAFYYGEDLSNE
jgi:nitroimidazol reductase NimA-like FMN-containing flavoprotein (pyridoxamine 5'-phosphate oxidase superfamily)